jgi:uncharacterized protein (TIGR01244 family)
MRLPFSVAVVAAAGALSVVTYAQQVTREEVAGVRNFARLETTVACAGATGPEAMPELKKMGFASVINLRQASEQGADVPAGEAAAKAAGLKYFHVPFNGGAPDPAVADAFLAAIRQPGNEPAFIHCAGGGRAAAMWMIKRLVLDKWDVERASEEATALGPPSPRLREFAIEYAKSHGQ